MIIKHLYTPLAGAELDDFRQLYLCYKEKLEVYFLP